MSPSEAAAWGALIASTAAAVVSIIVALKQPKIAQKVEEVHAAVSVSNGHTLGELVETNAQRNDAQDDAAGVPRS